MSPEVRPSPDAAWVVHELVVYAARLPDGPPLVLAGTGATVWHAALEAGSLDEVCARVATATGTPAEVVTPAVTEFVASLADAGLLVVAATG